MLQTVELQIVQGLLALFLAFVTAGIGYVTPHVKAWFQAHMSATYATMATNAFTGLGQIAENVVQDFNQRVVTDAKANGMWTPALAASVKKDAVAAVKDQGAALYKLVGNLGNADAMVEALVEQSVAKHKKVAPSVPVDALDCPLRTQE